MFEVKGKYNTAKIFTDMADSATVAQVLDLMNQPSVRRRYRLRHARDEAR